MCPAVCSSAAEPALKVPVLFSQVSHILPIQLLLRGETICPMLYQRDIYSLPMRLDTVDLRGCHWRNPAALLVSPVPSLTGRLASLLNYEVTSTNCKRQVRQLTRTLQDSEERICQFIGRESGERQVFARSRVLPAPFTYCAPSPSGAAGVWAVI